MESYITDFARPMQLATSAKIIANPTFQCPDGQLHEDLQELWVGIPQGGSEKAQPQYGYIELANVLCDPQKLKKLEFLAIYDHTAGTESWRFEPAFIPSEILNTLGGKPPSALKKILFQYVELPLGFVDFIKVVKVTVLGFNNIATTGQVDHSIDLISKSIRVLKFSACDQNFVQTMVNQCANRAGVEPFSLCMAPTQLTDSLWNGIKKSFSSVGSVTFFGSTCNFFEVQCKFFHEAWTCNKNLVEICFDGCEITPKTFEELNEFIFSAKSLQVVRFDHWKKVWAFDLNEDIEMLLATFKKSTHLRWLQWTGLPCVAGFAIAKALPDLPFEAAALSFVKEHQTELSPGVALLGGALQNKKLGVFEQRPCCNHAHAFGYKGLSAVGTGRGGDWAVFNDVQQHQLMMHQRNNLIEARRKRMNALDNVVTQPTPDATPEKPCAKLPG